MTSSPAHQEENLEAFGIASALVKARSARGMSQSDLAEQSGVSRSAIKGYETGRNMPGSRELRALCKTLHVSPNMLLFGTETPFAGEPSSASESAGMRLFLSDPEDAKKARLRLAYLADLLTIEEVEALMRLVHSLAVARHGPEVVDQQILGADLATAMGLALQAVGAAGAAGKSAVDVKAVMEGFLERQGHKPKDS